MHVIMLILCSLVNQNVVEVIRSLAINRKLRKILFYIKIETSPPYLGDAVSLLCTLETCSLANIYLILVPVCVQTLK